MQGSGQGQVVTGITIVGGFYRESCRFPASDEYWGSGGRAAAAIHELGIPTKLVTTADINAKLILSSIAKSIGFQFSITPVPATIVFQYDHGLSTPIIWPRLHDVERVQLRAQADCILQFGMLDADAEIDGRVVVYDPQEPNSPKHFCSSNRPTRLAYVLNRTEARQLGNSDDLGESLENIARHSGAQVIVVKRGARGALVWENGKTDAVPAYETKHVWPIGSGDVFAAVFAARWGVQDASALEAANSASRATADYVQNQSLPIPKSVIEGESPFPPLHVNSNKPEEGTFDVYLAGPFFNMPQLWLVDEARIALKGMGLRVFSPYHDIGVGHGCDVAPKDIAALEKSRVVLAFLDGGDPGTLFEVGYARAKRIPVIALAQCTPEEPLKMVSGTACEICSDFVTAIYKSAWAAWK